MQEGVTGPLTKNPAFPRQEWCRALEEALTQRRFCTYLCHKLGIFLSSLVYHSSWSPFAHLDLLSLRDILHKTCLTSTSHPLSNRFHLIIVFTICQPFLAFSHQAKLNCRTKARIVTNTDLVKSFDITPDASINYAQCHFSGKLLSFFF